MKVVPAASQSGAAAQVPGAASPRRGCPARTRPAAGPHPASPPTAVASPGSPPLSPPHRLSPPRPSALLVLALSPLSSHLLHLRWSQWLFSYKSLAGSAAQSSVLWISRFFEVAQLTFGGEIKAWPPLHAVYLCGGCNQWTVCEQVALGSRSAFTPEGSDGAVASLSAEDREEEEEHRPLSVSLSLQLHWGQGGCGVPPTYAHVFAHTHAPTGGHTALWEGS